MAVAVSRFAATTQDRCEVLPSERPMVGSALETTVWSIDPMKTGSRTPATIHMVSRCVRASCPFGSAFVGAFIPSGSLSLFPPR